MLDFMPSSLVSGECENLPVKCDRQSSYYQGLPISVNPAQ
ncbi:hypothetical protein NIES2109_16410 [Nostoc sp. HK-01]|nr:hypothetical protein NIES2109_16410 [Nostoc sp. HK-01]